MLDLAHTASAAPIRRFSLNLFSVFYWFIYSIGWAIVIKQKWSIVRFGWKQLLSLLVVIFVESRLRPHFKVMMHFTQPFGLFYPKYSLIYIGIALVAAFVTAYHIGNKVEHYCEKRERLHICAIVGAYYVGYYTSYTLLNMLLIGIDHSNLLGVVHNFM